MATTGSLSSTRGVEARALDEGLCVTPGNVEETKEDCSSKLVGELGPVSWASEGSHSVYLPPTFVRESNENLSHIFGPEKFTCIADVGSNKLKLDNSVVSYCGDTQLQGGDTNTARCALGYVPGGGDTERTFSCPPDGVVSGTQPVCEPLPCSAPKSDSENSEDMCRDTADERSCGVSWASGYSIVGDSAVWPRMTNDSGTNSIPEGTLQKFDDFEGIADTGDGVGLGVNCALKAPLAWLKLTHVFGTTAPPLNLTILLLRAHQSALLLPSHQQV